MICSCLPSSVFLVIFFLGVGYKIIIPASLGLRALLAPRVCERENDEHFCSPNSYWPAGLDPLIQCVTLFDWTAPSALSIPTLLSKLLRKQNGLASRCGFRRVDVQALRTRRSSPCLAYSFEDCLS